MKLTGDAPRRIAHILKAGEQRLERETFDVKIDELKKTYEYCLSVISQIEKLDDEKIQMELNSLEMTKDEMYAKLEDVVCHAKSDLSSELADIQLMYCRKLEHVLNHLENLDMDLQGKSDAKCLAAEYAIDHAVHSLKYALYAVLLAAKAP
ncbi:MAG: hypothetical protein LUE92_06980 [Clostridiales bacterium]|nr:hypothetical protein [Clostridiales bacterium]